MSGQRAEALRSRADACERVLKERVEVAHALSERDTKEKLKQVVKPNSISRTLRATGFALLVAPDPLTGVPGAIMLGASMALKTKDPASVESVFNETRKVLAELRSSLL